MRILREPGAGGEGGGGSVATAAPDWKLSLPEDLRGEASLQSLKTVGDLAKSYVHAQRMVGVEKIPAPQKSWTDKEWNELYDRIGRPPTPEKYELPKVDLEEGLTLDEQKFNELKKTFHGMGLTNSQARKLFEFYVGRMNEAQKQQRMGEQTARQKAEQDLRQEWPDYDLKVNSARAVVQQFGTPEFVEYLDKSGLGNDPRLVRMLVKIGEAMLEDTARTGDVHLQIGDAGRANAEIKVRMQDKDFMDALMDARHRGHAEAVDIWTRLHAIATPGKQQET